MRINELKFFAAACAVLGVGLMSATAGEVTVNFTFTADDVTVENVDGYQRLRLAEGLLPHDTPGTPWLPARTVNILIPSGAEVTSMTVAGEEILFQEDVVVYPVQPPCPPSRPRPPFILGFLLGRLAEGFLFTTISRYGAAWLWRPWVIILFCIVMMLA
ncbi:MAG: hypothetical protein KJ726_02235, partial [Verrucomicrobia bacterium]|nr:hypothetical protein [Verrucomicrobiota bacterium]